MKKYEYLWTKASLEAAEIVGVVEKRNYLAHTIRDIEMAILQLYNKHYHIITCTARNAKNSRIYFFDKGCEIQLSCECEEMDDRKIRLILAHELGHLIFYLNKITNPEILEAIKLSEKEERYAWEFAYHLIGKKSEEYQNSVDQNKFIYRDEELKQSLISVLKSKRPELSDAILNSLFPQP